VARRTTADGEGALAGALRYDGRVADESANQPIAGGAVGDAAKARAHALVGRTLLGRYRIDSLVAMGGLASVFHATRVSDGQEVAIKVLHADEEGLPELVERFRREAIAGKHILHPNVVTVHEIAQLEDGGWFLVQDFVRGETLRAVIDRGPVAPRRAARMALHVAAGLTAAHDMGIVHRDIKPRNLMLVEGPDDKVQIVDFGLAKVPVEDLSLLDDDGRRSLTQAGVVMGTVAYMAPEAALGMRSVDRRSDLYALGVILYEMLAGVHPFTAKDAAEMFQRQRHAIPPAIRERAPGVEVPAALEAVVRRLLEKDPDARYPHARALTIALESALRSMGPASVAPAAGPTRRFLPRLPLPIVIALAALALAAAAVGLVLLRG
jgi:serine/threonine-protein kinase